jgi:hypothetical protein
MESREPTQPLNVLLGLLLGIAALAYDIAMVVG